MPWKGKKFLRADLGAEISRKSYLRKQRLTVDLDSSANRCDIRLSGIRTLVVLAYNEQIPGVLPSAGKVTVYDLVNFPEKSRDFPMLASGVGGEMDNCKKSLAYSEHLMGDERICLFHFDATSNICQCKVIS